MIKTTLDPNKTIQFPHFLKWLLIRELSALVIGFGFQPEHME